jgi:hypothetical protein
MLECWATLQSLATCDLCQVPNHNRGHLRVGPTTVPAPVQSNQPSHAKPLLSPAAPTLPRALTLLLAQLFCAASNEFMSCLDTLEPPCRCQSPRQHQFKSTNQSHKHQCVI